MLQAPQNSLIIRVKSKYISNFSELVRISALQNNTSIHLEDLVNIVGEVVSLPRVISQDRMHKGFSIDGIKIGDTVLFAFNVIYDFVLKDKDAYEAPLYKNMIKYHGDEFWLADITRIFGVIKEDRISMVNGYVMAGPYQEDAIILNGTAKKSKKTKSSEVYHYNGVKETQSPIAIKPGDFIHYNTLKVQKYQINNKPFIILQQDKVLGKSV